MHAHTVGYGDSYTHIHMRVACTHSLRTQDRPRRFQAGHTLHPPAAQRPSLKIYASPPAPHISRQQARHAIRMHRRNPAFALLKSVRRHEFDTLHVWQPATRAHQRRPATRAHQRRSASGGRDPPADASSDRRSASMAGAVSRVSDLTVTLAVRELASCTHSTK